MRIVSKRFASWVRVDLDARERFRGRDRWVATGGGDELGGLAGGRVELAVGAVDGAVLAVQDVRDRVAQSGEHEHEAQRHRDADDGEGRAAPVAAEAAHDHPPARREMAHGRHDPFEQRPRTMTGGRDPHRLGRRCARRGARRTPRGERGRGNSRRGRDDHRRRVQRRDVQRQAERVGVHRREPPAEHDAERHARDSGGGPRDEAVAEVVAPQGARRDPVGRQRPDDGTLRGHQPRQQDERAEHRGDEEQQRQQVRELTEGLHVLVERDERRLVLARLDDQSVVACQRRRGRDERRRSAAVAGVERHLVFRRGP